MFYQFRNKNLLGKMLNIHGEDVPFVSITHDYTGIKIPVGRVTVISGKEAGNVLGPEDRVVPANKRVRIEPLVPFNPGLYHAAVVTINQEIFEVGVAQCQTVVHHGDGDYFAVYVTTSKAMNLDDLEYLIKLSVIS